MGDGNPHLAVDMRNITKVFPGVRALDNVSFNVKAGEVHALAGKNGAGKSTLMHILTGLYPFDLGELLIRGQAYGKLNTAGAKAAGIALVAQHTKIIPGLSIAENVFAGNLALGRYGFVDWKRIFEEATARLANLAWTWMSVD